MVQSEVTQRAVGEAQPSSVETDAGFVPRLIYGDKFLIKEDFFEHVHAMLDGCHHMSPASP